ncbi:CBS domain-containing protein [Desulfotomaculum arcticum]|uniref:CBS domain-containing protein n=1 Tax=Desulfotruncus arcticus DSM 17038 TaxID=1121424 RepID=A0A1I2WHR7_9FIRM|nr:CBS domain-containing protein [Desulfotruncus arcticus]SFH00217.1 CBS domain-containing protein [Desulfotomaculum arcticum] [Desulfotruncus arcticus DSM 17038]
MTTVAFFVIPKQDVVFLDKNATMRQALEKMEYHRYTAIPIIDELGKYAGTITEGDLLWKIKNNPGLTFDNTAKVSLKQVPQRMKNLPVSINATMEELIGRAIEQNFIPVVDDDDVFIGIVRRREIIEYCSKLIP